MKYFLIILIVISALLVVASLYIRITQPECDIDQLLFSCMYGLKDGDLSPIYEALKYCVPALIFILIMDFLLLWGLPIPKEINTFYLGFFIVIINVFLSLYNIKFFSMIYNKIKKSNFIEENTVDANNVNVVAPKNKKNLIYIFLESFESTVLEENCGGRWKYPLVPEIQDMIKSEDTICFKNSMNKIGNKTIYGANYTTAAVFASFSGLPFKTYLTHRLSSNNFFNNVYTLGDLLKDNGYHNEVISSARTSYGAFKDFFNIHGKYDIIDVDSYKEYGLSLKDKDKHPWGFNDNYLFNTAKKRLKELSKKNEPFNLTLIGIDTHFPDGFKGDYTLDKFESKMSNTYATESKLVYDFVSWVKKQDFYKDTLICIVGDHLSMDNRYYKGIDMSDRLVFSTFINVSKKNINTSNREYSSLDLYPSILSALDFKIDGNKLGMGTDIFSDEKTLLERVDFKRVNKEIQKRSTYYEKILKK